MRLVIIASVDQRGKRSCLLYHRHGVALSECTRCKLGRSHGILRVNQAVRLTRQVNSRQTAETENILIAEKFRCSHLLSDLHHTSVAGVFQYIGRCLYAMCSRISSAADHLPCNRLKPLTVKQGIIIDYIEGICRRHVHRFCRGTWLVCIGNTVVFPYGTQSLHCLVIVHRINFFLRIERCQISWIVQVIPVGRIHTKNLSIVRIHHDNADILCCFCLTVRLSVRFVRAVLDMNPLIVILDRRADDLLNIYINRRNHVFARLRLDDRLFHIRIFVVIAELAAIHAI